MVVGILERNNNLKITISRPFEAFFIFLHRISLNLNKYETSSPKGNDRSSENKQVFSNSSLVSKRFFNWSRAANSAVQG